MGRALCLLLALCLGGVAARCVRNGWDRLSRAPLANALNVSRRALSAESEQELLNFLSGEYERQASDLCNKVNVAEWNFNTDLTNPNVEGAYNEATLALAEFEKQQWQAHFQAVDITTIQDASLKRQLKYLQSLGTSALSSDQLALLNQHLLKMQNTYSTAKICPYEKKDSCDLATEGLNLDPGIEELITTSRDYDVLTHLWTAWHDASGKLMREDYKEYVKLSNEAAVANNFKDMGLMWQASYEVDDFVKTIDDLWLEVQPLYQELHTYTLSRLRKLYGEKIPKDKNLIPGHLLGNMWGQTWINLYDLLVPYPEASSYDVTTSLVDQGYTAKKMFETADQFYQSMGLKPNAMCYGEKAMITKPTDGREVTCHASAWDFCDGQDFRIKMCTKINQDDFRTIHHEMGHIQYYQQYAPLPYVLRTGANPGFHEAIGDTIALSVDTPKHLTTVGLLSDYVDSKESRVNSLMKMALEKVAFLPFGLLVDKWRWEVFAGLDESRWNARWWELKEKYQMLSAPVARSEDDFDPGAKYHVPADSKYISYFVAHILQFQFYKALCIEAKQYDPNDANSAPLHTCDFYQSQAAGQKLAAGLVKGASVHWTETLQAMTGETKMTGRALMEYFQPLYEFLKEANQEATTPTTAPTTAAPATAPTPTATPAPASAVAFAPALIMSILIPLFVSQFTNRVL